MEAGRILIPYWCELNVYTDDVWQAWLEPIEVKIESDNGKLKFVYVHGLFVLDQTYKMTYRQNYKVDFIRITSVKRFRGIDRLEFEFIAKTNWVEVGF